ncbi:MAG: acyl-CoA dehydrogenase family protein [Planctomycetes bacterium]|nr:acyl-CoA dehydrogenase family protein [Planctomycetota bacterium]MCB9888432.1 acyl-CoA dehydrogenase family protein [Planctomycetota bacterium]
MATDSILPDRELDAPYREFAQRIRAFANDQLEPHARAIDEQRRFMPETVRALGAAGILGGPIATAHGGEGWDALQIVLANEEVGAVCGSARGLMAVQSGLVAQCLEQFGDDAQRGRWLGPLIRGEVVGCFALTEDDAGSDVASLACRASVGSDGSYRLAGTKTWITNGGVADIALVFATVDPARGRDGITCFLVELEAVGVQRAPVAGVELGHRGSNHARLSFHGSAVPAEAVVGGVGNGFAVAMGGLSCGRISVAAGAVGIQRAALSSSIEFVNARQQFGKPLAAFQMVQERIADMAADLLASRALVYRCARLRMAGSEGPGDLAAAKLFATEAASRAADTAVMLHGSRGYSSAYPPERLLRDALGLRIYEGTSMIQKSILARSVLRS